MRYDFTETDEVARRVNDAPRWMDRPDRPGTWVCVGSDTDGFGRIPDCVVHLTQEMLDKGAPFVSKRVYGPIPEDKQIDIPRNDDRPQWQVSAAE